MSPFGNAHWEVQQYNMWLAWPTYKQLSVPVWSLAVSDYWNAQQYFLSFLCQIISLCIVSFTISVPFAKVVDLKK